LALRNPGRGSVHLPSGHSRASRRSTENEPSCVRNEVKLLEAFVWQRKFRDEEDSVHFQGGLFTPFRSGRGDRDAGGQPRRITSGDQIMICYTPLQHTMNKTALGKM